MLPLGLLPGLALLEGIRHSDSLVELGASLQIRARGSRVLLGGAFLGVVPQVKLLPCLGIGRLSCLFQIVYHYSFGTRVTRGA